jgi:cold shock CspA family protein
VNGKPKRGTLIWFNVEKGYGFIRTEQDERLRVSAGGFQPGCEPDARCAGQEVLYDVRGDDGELGAPGEREAVDVHFPTAPAPRRARLRHSR